MSGSSLQRYLSSKKEPLLVFLELTHRCSFLCVHCYIPEELRRPSTSVDRFPKGLSTAEITALLEELAAAGTLFLVFTGGEIFLRPDLEEITARAVELGFAVKYYTNGFHITPRWADRIKALGLYAVDISLYGASEETYRAVTQIRGGFKRVLNAIEYLRQRDVRVIIKTPVLRENVQDIPKIKEIAQSHGAMFRYDLVIIPRFNGDLGPLVHRCEDDQIKELLEAMGARFEPKEEVSTPTCAVGRWSAVVSPEGEVFPCIEMRQSIGNVRKQSFSVIWKDNPHMRRIRQILDSMDTKQSVFSDGMCGHCPANSLHSVGDMTKPSPEHMRVANIKREFLAVAR